MARLGILAGVVCLLLGENTMQCFLASSTSVRPCHNTQGKLLHKCRHTALHYIIFDLELSGLTAPIVSCSLDMLVTMLVTARPT